MIEEKYLKFKRLIKLVINEIKDDEQSEYFKGVVTEKPETVAYKQDLRAEILYIFTHLYNNKNV